MSTGVITVGVAGLLPLKRQMQLLSMPAPLRRRLLFRTTKRVIADSKRRVRKQVDLKGHAFEKRKRKSRRKMLSSLVKELKVVRNNSLESVIGFSSFKSASIAAKQQHGFTQTISARKLAKLTKGSHNDPATRKQAKALREAGFQIKTANGKRMKTPSLKWVTENMKIGQAGAALRYLRDKASEEIKQSWKTVLPARAFLGASAVEISQHVETIFKQFKQEMNYVAR